MTATSISQNSTTFDPIETAFDNKYLLKHILSFTGPNASFATTSKLFRAAHTEALEEMGRRLLTKENIVFCQDYHIPLPPFSRITPEEGERAILQACLNRVKQVWKNAPLRYIDQFKNLTPNLIVTSPNLFRQITSLPYLVQKIIRLSQGNLDEEELRAIIDPEDDAEIIEEDGPITEEDEQRIDADVQLSKIIKKEELDLFGLKKTYLPNALELFTSLKALEVRCNDVSSIPESSTNITTLENLTLDSCLLTSLPQGFGNLSSLKNLNLNGNKLTSLPSSFGNISTLKELHLCSNKLSFLPDSFGNLDNLESLDLSENQFKTLPKTMKDLSHLKLLDILDNELKLDQGLCSILANLQARGCEILCDAYVQQALQEFIAGMREPLVKQRATHPNIP